MSGPGEESSREVRLPATWQGLFGEATGVARFERKFNQPTGLTAEDRLWILLPDHCGKVRSFKLNGVTISPDDAEAFSFEITSVLALHNLLSVELEQDSLTERSAGLWSPVVLEIRSPVQPE